LYDDTNFRSRPEALGKKLAFLFCGVPKNKLRSEKKQVFLPCWFSAEIELSTAENLARKSTIAETRTKLRNDTTSFRTSIQIKLLVRDSSEAKHIRKTSTTTTTTGERVELGNFGLG
jgi:hypothetical protein